MYEYKARLDKVIDGDTADFIVDLGFNIKIKIRGRLLGVDTPERGDPNWAVATEKLSKLIADKGEHFIIKTEKTEKYGRWLVDIEDVNDKLKQVWPWED